MSCTGSPIDQSSLPSLVGRASGPKWCMSIARATAPCRALTSSASSAYFAVSTVVGRPSFCFLSTSAFLKCFDAASVQSALGSSTPPALIENSSMSVGMMTTRAPFGSALKPGARFFESDWPSAGAATASASAHARTRTIFMVISPCRHLSTRRRDLQDGLRGLDVARFDLHVEERLALLFLHHLQRALERRQQLLRLGDGFAVAAARLHHVLETRRRLEGGEGRLLHLRRVALRISR